MGLAVQSHKCLVYQTESFLSRDLEAFTSLGIEPPGPSREDGAGATLASEVAPAPDRRPPSFNVCQHSSAVLVEDRPSLARSALQLHTVGHTVGRDFSATFSARDVGLSRGRPRGHPRSGLLPHPSPSRLLDAHVLEVVRARHTSPLHLARLTSLQGGGAGAWLQSVPYADPLRFPVAGGFIIPPSVATTIDDTVKFMLRDFAVEAGFAVKVEDSLLFTQLEAAWARLQGQPAVGEGARAEGPLEQGGEARQPGGGGQWGQHQLRGRVARGVGGQRGRQGEQSSHGREGGQQGQHQESQQMPQAPGATFSGSGSGVGQGREQQRADRCTGGGVRLGGEDQGVREAAGDRAEGLGGVEEGREGEGRGQVGGGEDRGRETTGEEVPRDQTGQQPAQQQGPAGRTGRVGTPSRIPDLTCRDVGQTLMVIVDVSIAVPQREGNVQLRRATPTQIGVAAARRV
ncbi:unnamed protein product [Closterium sp. Yama58-4]|nr:unnamed protein product [Closterium sp. Yama58-4]